MASAIKKRQPQGCLFCVWSVRSANDALYTSMGQRLYLKKIAILKACRFSRAVS